MKEMKIARYYMEHLFNHAFEYVEFNHVIFNPEMIKLLFDDKPLQLHIKKANLYIDNEQHKCFLKFALDNLMANELGIYFAKVNYMGQYTDILFKILTNGGNKFSKVCIQGFKLSELYNPIIQHIEMSRNCSKIVANIIIGCDVGLYINLSEQAENIKNLHKFTKYQLSNKYNPKMRFSIYNGQYKNGLVYAEIKKISG
uniref:Tudor domain-containing protein n=1 Tax=Meloidogyne hapla TaxID=6305 RepID=A0A1I8B1N4_MELHA